MQTKLNTMSSTEAELVVIDDTMDQNFGQVTF